MKKLLLTIAVAGFLVSCTKSMEDDAKRLAEITCKIKSDDVDSEEKMNLATEVAKIEKKYNDEEKVKLANMALDMAAVLCGDKVSQTASEPEVDNESNNLNSDQKDYSFVDEQGNGEIDESSYEGDDSDFDRMLNDYEKYVNQYVTFLKKSQSGDMEALSEYPALYEKSIALQISIQKAQKDNKLTVKQVKRMNDINLKMMQEMQQNTVEGF